MKLDRIHMDTERADGVLLTGIHSCAGLWVTMSFSDKVHLEVQGEPVLCMSTRTALCQQVNKFVHIQIKCDFTFQK